MNGDILTWTAIIAGGGGGSIITFITFWMAIASKIESIKGQADLAAEKAKNAEAMSTVAFNKIEMITRENSENNIKLNSRISTLEAIQESTNQAATRSEARLAKGMDDVSYKLDAVEKRLGEIEVKIAGIAALIEK